MSMCKISVNYVQIYLNYNKTANKQKIRMHFRVLQITNSVKILNSFLFSHFLLLHEYTDDTYASISLACRNCRLMEMT